MKVRSTQRGAPIELQRLVANAKAEAPQLVLLGGGARGWSEKSFKHG